MAARATAAALEMAASPAVEASATFSNSPAAKPSKPRGNVPLPARRAPAGAVARVQASGHGQHQFRPAGIEPPIPHDPKRDPPRRQLLAVGASEDVQSAAILLSILRLVDARAVAFALDQPRHGVRREQQKRLVNVRQGIPNPAEPASRRAQSRRRSRRASRPEGGVCYIMPGDSRWGTPGKWVRERHGSAGRGQGHESVTCVNLDAPVNSRISSIAGEHPPCRCPGCSGLPVARSIRCECNGLT